MSLSSGFLRYSKFVLVGLIALFVAFFSANEAKAETTMASWYGPGFAGNPTASGETYDPSGFTAAHKSLPLGTTLTVSYGGRAVDVVVNDRGPFVGSRGIDLSQGAAEYLGLTAAGVDYVDYTVTGGYSAPADQYSAPATESYAQPDVATQGYAPTQDYVPEQTGGAGYAGGSAPQVDQSGGQGGSYVVQSGDTLNEISNDLGTSVEDLAAANGISNPNVISVGQTLSY
ncbi:MAG: septal ring lytic transglycosylase RlpA family protein [Rubrobacteraceae bacterium]